MSNAAALAALNAIVDLVDVGGTGYIEIRTGTPPTNVEDAATGTLLGTCTMSATAFLAATDANPGATVNADTITDDTSADNDGTAGWFRLYSGAGTGILQGDVTATSGGGDLELDNVSITTGDTISITGYTVNLPEN
jgi:hypothetical protein